MRTFWNLARIKTTTEQNCERRLEALWNKWRSLQRSKARETDSNEGRRKFADDLDKLWDIGDSDAIAELRESRLMSSSLTLTDSRRLSLTPSPNSEKAVCCRSKSRRKTSGSMETSKVRDRLL